MTSKYEEFSGLRVEKVRMRIDSTLRHNIVITFTILNIALLIYSFGGIFSKTAALSNFLSFKFIGCYGMVIMILGIYSMVWQQIIKRMSLSTAYASKAVTIVWGILWGCVLFHEEINVGKLMGAVFIIIGIIVYANADIKEDNNN